MRACTLVSSIVYKDAFVGFMRAPFIIHEILYDALLTRISGIASFLNRGHKNAK